MKKNTKDCPSLPITKQLTDEGMSYRMGQIRNITTRRMLQLLGKPNSEGDPYKVKHEWEFVYNGIRCVVWDYKGSQKYGIWSYLKKRKEQLKTCFPRWKGLRC